jgi:ankyrin repeat protein
MQEALCDASRAGDTERIKDLLLRGADVNKGGYWAPIHCTAAYRQLRAAELLLDSRADVDARTDDGKTALHLVASSCDYECALLLLDRKASVNAQNNHGQTPLHIVVDMCPVQTQASLAEVLFQRGASLCIRNYRLSIRNQLGETPLVMAQRLERHEIARKLELLKLRIHRCLAAVLALLGCPMHHDIRNLLARLVWETRRDPVWDERGAKKERF